MPSFDAALDAPAGFTPPDRSLLDAIRHHDAGLRALLCTLARHGVALRRDAPARAQAWLDELAPHPLFKGGQFLFDLLEWEDFMLDGQAPPVLDVPALQAALDRLAAALRSLGAPLDAPRAVPAVFDLGPAERALPALASGFYLYHDVVLGGITLLTRDAPPQPA